MEQKIIDRNVEHFGQAQNTIFTRAPLSETFNYEGTGNTVDLLLNSKLDQLSLGDIDDRGALTLLQKLSSGSKLPSINDDFSYTELTRAIKKWAERTSTSPSGRHLGHYKVILADNRYAYDESYLDPNNIIMQVYYNIATSAMLQGISLERWQHVTTSMIKKSSGCSRINKLRVIHLYVADYNLLLKI